MHTEHQAPSSRQIDFRYGRSLIYTLRRHGLGLSENEAAKTAEGFSKTPAGPNKAIL